MFSSGNRKRVIFSVTNCICHDQRVLKIAETVSNLGYDIIIVGRKSGNCCNSVRIPLKTKRFRMLFNKGFIFYKFFNIRLFFYLLFHNCHILVANDLDTLLPNFLISKLKRLPLVYDSHEYFTGVPELQGRPFVKWIWKVIEKMIFPSLKYIMTVSDSVALQYETEYGKRPLTVRNCSRRFEYIVPYSRKELGVERDHLLLVLQGTGINIDRGAEELVEAISITENVSLLIVGEGDIIEDLKLKAGGLALTGRVKFIPKVQWEEMMRYTKSADAGLSLDKDSNMNYKLSLPNKLFDYLSAGIPVIAGNLHEVSGIIEYYKCGLIISSITPLLISAAIKKLRDNHDLLRELKKGAEIASGSLLWENESKKVTDFYRALL